jgi:hypothetical protein
MTDKSAGWLALAGASGAIVGAAVTGGFNYFSHRGDLDAKMIELSVGILRSEPTPETTPLREWAIDVIDKRARFEFNAAQRAALLKQELPFRGSALSTVTVGMDSAKLREAIQEELKRNPELENQLEAILKKLMQKPP